MQSLYTIYQFQNLKLMKVNMEPKTLEDYRDLTKVLKLKIVKQSKTIQQLEVKCKKYEEQINGSMANFTSRQQLNLTNTKAFQEVAEDELSTLKGKSSVMRKFLRAANMFGITPQSIYRIADVFYTNGIESDYFRSILSKMALNLTPKQISCLIFIFDQNCSGYISKEDFDNSLHAYEIGIEERSLPYTQECLLRFCGLLYAERIDLNKFYDEMKQIARTKNSQGHVDLIVFEQQTKKYFAAKLQQRQIVGAFNQINLQKQRSIERKNFLYGVNSFTNRLLSDDRSKIQTFPMTVSQPTNQNLKNSRSQLRVPNNVNNQSSISIQRGGTQSQFLRHQQPEQHPLEKILRQKNVQFQDIVLQIVQLPMKSRVSIHQFKKCFSKMLTEFSSEDINVIFKSLDSNQQGSIDIFDAINFCLIHFKDVHLVLMLIGKSLQCTSTSPEEFWNSQQFEDFSRLISKSKFLEIMAKSCKTQNPQSWEVVWNFFDKGKGTITVQSIIEVWKKYQVQ